MNRDCNTGFYKTRIKFCPDNRKVVINVCP